MQEMEVVEIEAALMQEKPLQAKQNLLHG